MKPSIFVLALFSAFLGYRVFQLENEVRLLQTNTAIAVLSAEAANNKIGAVAPFFSQDKEQFANAWLDTFNMPLAVFPEEVLAPLKRTLVEKRNSAEGQRLKTATFK